MNRSRVFGSVVASVFAFTILLSNPSQVDALAYSLTTEFDITVNDDLSALVKQNIVVTNNSDEFLSSSISLDFPFRKVGALQVESGGNLLPASIENDRLWIEFADNPLDFGEQKTLSVEYQIPGFVERFGDVRSFLWPRFVVENEETSYIVKINYPLDWEDVLYTSQGIDLNHAFETRRAIAFDAVDKPLRVYVGNYTLKQISLSISDDVSAEGKRYLNIPVKKDAYFVGDNNTLTLGTENDQAMANIDLDKYFKSRGLMMMAKPGSVFPETQIAGKYYSGVGFFQGLNTDDPAKLYQIVLSRLNPSRSILEWSRNSVSEILEKTSHTDLDYANTLTAVLHSKNIPAHVVYGITRYPDGKFYWHFWTIYQEKIGDEIVWREVDPYLGDLTGDEYFKNIPPVRVVWGILGTESDLSDISVDLFSIMPDKFDLKYFSSSSIQTGYITSQLNKQAMNLSGTDSVLGTESIRLPHSGGLGYNGGGAVSIMAGVVLVAFARYFYLAEVKHRAKYKLKTK